MIEQGTPVRDIFREWESYIDKQVLVNGWVRTRRDSKAGISFVEVNDGSCLKNIQIIINHDRTKFQDITKVITGAAVSIRGIVRRSPAKGQPIEVETYALYVIGPSDPALYPLQKKRHSFEFLREIAHLRPRTNTIGAVIRVRNKVSYTIHRFFQERGFYYIHTPIITTIDCEGAGDVFRVIAPGNDFFGKPTYLTVSGQLQAEAYALALGKVYTFGPTFRAENSQTRRHLAEFWMIEPEMAFADLENDLALAQEFMQYVVWAVLNECSDDLDFFARFIDPELYNRLHMVAEKPFEIITYTEAIPMLKASKIAFTYPPEWGYELQAEHERCLTEKIFKRPVAVINFPRDIKPFYMKVNDDGKTVSAMDVLVPGIGEIIGGSEREYRYDVLIEQMKFKEIDIDAYNWYLDLRKYGSVPHAGFGLGLERLVQFLTGVSNIRETIPFPRSPGYAFA